jgi:hypothetical protein
MPGYEWRQRLKATGYAVRQSKVISEAAIGRKNAITVMSSNVVSN